MDRRTDPKRTAGCLILMLVPMVLVNIIFFSSGLFMLTIKVFGLTAVDPALIDEVSSSWFSIIVTLAFSFPLLVVIVRALYISIVFRVTGRRLKLVTWKLLLPASVFLGFPGLVFSLMAVLGLIAVPLDYVPWAVAGSLVLVTGPVVLWRIQRN